MAPRHFWWLAETLTEGLPAKRGVASQNDRAAMLALLEKAERGEF